MFIGIRTSPFLLKNFQRYSLTVVSTTKNPINIAVIGSGPSAFYTILHVLQKQDPSDVLNIDIYEKFPVPFGLSRYGVAPDHPEVKNCEDKFHEIMEETKKLNTTSKSLSEKPIIKSRVQFFGNLEIGGQNLSLETLIKNYNSIIFAYGASRDNQLNIKGADLPGVISSRSFVGWYNDNPDFENLNVPLDKVEDVVIIGNGNVALDVARVLLKPVDDWKNTDLSEKVLKVLRSSKIKKVTIVARRGFLQSAFTNKELRELLELPMDDIQLERLEDSVFEQISFMKANLKRVEKRRVEMFEKYFRKLDKEEAQGERTNKKAFWSLQYLKSPVEIFGNSRDPQLLSSTKFVINKLEENINEPAKVVSTNDYISIKSDLLITSIGYKGTPIKGMEKSSLRIKFDHARGIIENKFSKVLNYKGDVIPGVYVSGWINYGPKGVIASTMMNSFSTGAEVLEDIKNGIVNNVEGKTGFDAVKSELEDKNVQYTTWNDWKQIDQAEKQMGQKVGKPRLKFTNVADILASLK